MERKTRIWIGLGAAVMVSGTTVGQAALAGSAAPDLETRAAAAEKVLGLLLVQESDAPTLEQLESGEGGPGEGGGQVLGTITEFRLGGDASKYAYDAKPQIAGYATLVHDTYAEALDGAVKLQAAVAALLDAPSDETLTAARQAWLDARPAYLRTEAYQFYAGPVDGPAGPGGAAGPILRLNSWPINPTFIDGMIDDPSVAIDFRSIARANMRGAADQVTTGYHAMEYLLWGAHGDRPFADFVAGQGSNDRRREYLTGVAQLLANDLKILVAAWAPGTNNFRASVEKMDQRNAIGRAFNGMTVLAGYEIPLRRIGAGMFAANVNFEQSPFSDNSAADNLYAFEGARNVWFTSGFDKLLGAVDPDLATRIAADFDAATAALTALNAPYSRFLAPASGSPEKAAGDAAVKALMDLGRDLKKAGNKLGVLVVVPGL